MLTPHPWCSDFNMEEILWEMILSARLMMPDHSSAERLVEGVLHQAIFQAENDLLTGDVREHLRMLLNEEYRFRGNLYLQ